MTIFQIAKQWRAKHGYAGRGGVVVIWAEIIQGWVRELPKAKDWVPGCVAVSEDGACYKAVGGNDSDGAEYWRAMEKEAA